MHGNADSGFRVGGFVPDTSVVFQAEVDGRVSNTVAVNVLPGVMRTGIILRDA